MGDAPNTCNYDSWMGMGPGSWEITAGAMKSLNYWPVYLEGEYNSGNPDYAVYAAGGKISEILNACK